MLGTILLVLLIVALAAVLGIVVHPLFWFIAIIAVLMLVAARDRGGA